jgi:hypothetical protein
MYLVGSVDSGYDTGAASTGYNDDGVEFAVDI